MFHRYFVFLATLLASTTVVVAQEVEPQIVTKRISENFYILYGGDGQGSNVGVSIGKDGILLVDAMHEKSNEKLIAAIRAISDKPIKYVINTHSDSDHSGGNKFFKDQGAIIIAQENAQYTTAVSDLKIRDALSFHFNDNEIHARHVVAHSYNDLIIYFPKDNVIFMGDTYTNTYHPYSYMEGMAGQFTALDIALNMADKNTVVVPGHGQVDNENGLLNYKKYCSLWVVRVGELFRQGASTEEMMDDPELNNIKDMFFTKSDPSRLHANSFKRFIERTLSADFVVSYPLTDDELSTFTGKYQFEDGLMMDVNLNDGVLITRTERNDINSLIPLSPTLFHVRITLGDTYMFKLDKSGRAQEVVLSSGDEKYHAKRVK